MGNNTSPAKITIILLNYERPRNIPIILKAIRDQTVKSDIFLWNNGGSDVDSPLIDRYERSDINVGCMARWKLGRQAKTPYVMSMDDDICFERKDAIENIIQSLEEQDDPNRIIGISGSCFPIIPIYDLRREFMCSFSNDTGQAPPSPLITEASVDIVKGRVMAFRKYLLDDISLPEEREDDIYLSAAFAKNARGFHRIPARLNNAFYELPVYGTGNYYKPGHYLSRNRALRTYFPSNVVLDNWLVRYVFARGCRVKNRMAKIFSKSKTM